MGRVAESSTKAFLASAAATSMRSWRERVDVSFVALLGDVYTLLAAFQSNTDERNDQLEVFEIIVVDRASVIAGLEDLERRVQGPRRAAFRHAQQLLLFFRAAPHLARYHVRFWVIAIRSDLAEYLLFVEWLAQRDPRADSEGPLASRSFRAWRFPYYTRWEIQYPQGHTADDLIAGVGPNQCNSHDIGLLPRCQARHRLLRADLQREPGQHVQLGPTSRRRCDKFPIIRR
jgi:hypothetical protein